MNKGTIAVVAVAIALLGWLTLRPQSEPDPAKPVTLEGYMKPSQQSEFRKRKENPLLFLSESKEQREKQFEGPPYDRLVLERKGARVVFEKDGDLEWTMVEPVRSKVEGFRLTQMVETFATDTALVPARTIKNADHFEDFGLDDKRAIKVELSQGGVTAVAMTIGNREKVKDAGDRGGADEYDTFVRLPDAPNEVYRAKKKDLRNPFDQDVAELRSKEIFSFDKSAITKVTISDPARKVAPEIVLSATWEAEPKEGADKEDAAAGDAKKDDEPKKKGTFAMVQPKLEGFVLGKLDSYFGQIAGVRATEFVMGEKPGPDSGLVGEARSKAPRVTVAIDGKDPMTLIFGAVKEKDKSFYAQVEGRDEYVIVSKYTRDNLLKGLGDLREKAVLGTEIKDEQVSRIEIHNEHTKGGAPLVFERRDTGWRMTSPVVMTPYEREIKSLVSGVRTLRAATFLDEKPGPEAKLAEPSLVITATIDGQPRTIRFGAERDSNVKAHLEGTQTYFEVSTWTRNKFTKKPIEFRDKSLMAVGDAAQILSMTLTHPNETIMLERVAGQPKAWKMTAPNAQTGADGLANDKVEAIANSLKALTIDKFTEKQAATVGLEAPSFTIVATMNDGTSRILKASDQQDAGNNYVSVQSPLSTPDAVYTLSRYKLDNLRKRVSDLQE